jgi:hypothetical protein
MNGSMTRLGLDIRSRRILVMATTVAPGQWGNFASACGAHSKAAFHSMK